MKFQADMFIGNDVLNKMNAVISYGKKAPTILENEIPFVVSAESRNRFLSNQCLIADFI